MATIARNFALNEARRVSSTPFEVIPEGFEVAAIEIDPLNARDRTEQLAALLRCLASLDIEKRQLVLFAYCIGESREALSERFDRPVSTIKTWLRRSLLQLKDCLSE